YT
ncbi:putative cytochrome b, partial [Chlamydia psittaci 02DC15]